MISGQARETVGAPVFAAHAMVDEKQPFGIVRGLYRPTLEERRPRPPKRCDCFAKQAIHATLATRSNGGWLKVEATGLLLGSCSSAACWSSVGRSIGAGAARPCWHRRGSRTPMVS